jgi:hypothetical protein
MKRGCEGARERGSEGAKATAEWLDVCRKRDSPHADP